MAVTLKEMIARLPAQERKAVEARAAELIAEEMTLRDLRKALELTQKRVAAKLDINQENLSRLERRSDLLLSTLRGYVEAMGGELRLVAEFPGRPPVILRGLAPLENEKTGQSRKPARRARKTRRSGPGSAPHVDPKKRPLGVLGGCERSSGPSG
ncbi:MAG: helix-turn-helix domain-containing protein [Alphaproteobacteria bacterium]